MERYMTSRQREALMDQIKYVCVAALTDDEVGTVRWLRVHRGDHTSQPFDLLTSAELDKLVDKGKAAEEEHMAWIASINGEGA